jgi:hypothetical protein
MHDALWTLPMATGWAMIHAHLSSQGIARKWAAQVGEITKEITGWRDGNPLQYDQDEDDNLAL